MERSTKRPGNFRKKSHIENCYAYLDRHLCTLGPAYQIKESKDPHTPVAILPLPFGQNTNERQAAYAALLAAAPFLLTAAKSALRVLDPQTREAKALVGAIKKATTPIV